MFTVVELSTRRFLNKRQIELHLTFSLSLPIFISDQELFAPIQKYNLININPIDRRMLG